MDWKNVDAGIQMVRGKNIKIGTTAVPDVIIMITVNTYEF